MNKTKDIILIGLIVILTGILGYGYYRDRRIQENVQLVAQNKENAYTDSIVQANKLYYNIQTADSSQKGYFLWAPYFLHQNSKIMTGSLIIMDFAGRVYYKKDFNQPVWDFRQWHINDKIYYTYLVNDYGTMNEKGVFFGKCHAVVLDASLKEIHQVPLYSHDDIKAGKGQGLDPHDLIMIAEDHFLALVGYEKTVNNIPDSLKPSPNGTQVVATVIQESKNGQVVWQWDATDHPELYGASKNDYSDTGLHDYTHVNTLLLDPKDSNVIVSFRDLNQLIKINRKTGEIMWRLGGKNSDFKLSSSQKFLGQHAASFTDNNKTLLFVDNGNLNKRPYTRIIEMQFDEQNKTVTKFRATKVPHLFFVHKGNVRKINEKYLVTGGLSQYIVMYDPETEEYAFDLRSNQKIYRSYYIDSIYGLEKNVLKNEDVTN